MAKSSEFMTEKSGCQPMTAGINKRCGPVTSSEAI